MEDDMGRIATLLAAALLLAACAGTRFEWSQAKKVQIGTTEAELMELLGKPYLIRTRNDVQVWVWSYADGLGGRGVVSFELKDGRVTVVPNMAPFQ
jgi:hypothetical protein